MGDISPANPIVLSRSQVRAFDRWAIQDLGIPGAVLMENAGRGCAEIIHACYNTMYPLKVTIVCGTGNNGGDGFVVARHLLNRGHCVHVLLCGPHDKVEGDARLHLDVLERLIGPVARVAAGSPNLTLEFAQADLIVDALFGTGLQGTPRPPYPAIIESINKSQVPVVAADIPSGLDCDTGEPWGQAVRAERTVTFVATKLGFQAELARKYTGEVIVAGIGIEPTQWPARSF